ncbi:DUF2398 family protein [Amycolatopsis sp. NPDC098790]|uniref:DUF2398 family protein n=1 Tax=Amycolatopsis sp. NPDC098790 TaxID=3363939 RepID=UPI0038222FAC
MRHDTLLHPDLAESARVLIAQGRLLAEREPELYRSASRGRAELARFFHTELGWTLEVLEAADLIRLHKRREDVPGARGLRIRREGQDPVPASQLVLVLSALACEQLWRRPRMTLNDLLQSVAQVCATDSESNLLPRFPVVPGDGVSKQEAHRNRHSLVDALRLLQADGTIAVDRSLDQAAGDGGDAVVSASRDRLTAKFSSLSPSLLNLAQLPPRRHASALATDRITEDDELPDDQDEPDLAEGPEARRAARSEITRRRLRAMRRLVDDPGVDPVADDYLQSSTGRSRALSVLHALGLVATVRHDWWQVSDPSQLGSTLDFPNGRRNERQAALALLRHLSTRDPTLDGRERFVAIEEIVTLFEQVREDLPRWAAAYGGQLRALAKAAANGLVDAGFLVAEPADDVPESRWRPTPAVRMWRVRLHIASGADSAQRAVSPTLFDVPEGTV